MKRLEFIVALVLAPFGKLLAKEEVKSEVGKRIFMPVVAPVLPAPFPRDNTLTIHAGDSLTINLLEGGSDPLYERTFEKRTKVVVRRLTNVIPAPYPLPPAYCVAVEDGHLRTLDVYVHFYTRERI